MDSFSIRRAVIEDAPGIALVKYNGWQDTYRGIIHDSYLDAMNLENLQNQWRQILSPNGSLSPTDVLVNAAGEVAGYITYGRHPNEKFNGDAEIYAFYVLKKYHRQGLGKKLFEHGMEQLRTAGLKSIYLLVIIGNPAVDFYRKFKPSNEYPVKTHIGGIDYDELVMVWRFE